MIENVRSVLSRHGIVLAGGMGDAAQCIHEMTVLMHGVRSEIKNAVVEYRDQSNSILDHESSVQARTIIDTADAIATMLRGTRIPSPVQCQRVMASLRIIVKAAWALQGVLPERPLQMIVALCKKAHTLAHDVDLRHHAPTWHDVLGAAEPAVQPDKAAPVNGLRQYLRTQPEHERAFKVRTYTVTFSLGFGQREVHVDVSNTAWDRDVLVTFSASVYNDASPGIYLDGAKGSAIRATTIPKDRTRRFPDFVKALTADAIRCADERYEELEQKYGTAQAAAEPQSDREYEDRDRIPYECVKFMATHKSSFSVNGMVVSVDRSNTRTTSVSDMLATVMLVFDNHGDKFNVLVDASKFNSYATVRFDSDVHRGAGSVHRIESKKLKDANPKAFIIELLRVTGLHHNAASMYEAKTVFEADIPEFVDGFLKVLLDDIPDRSVPDFDEDNPKMLGERWDTYHVSTDDQHKATAIARSFYKRASAVLGAFLVKHGPDCMPAHRDLGYMTAQEITGGGITFTDLNEPTRLRDSEAWESLMEHLCDCCEAVVGPIRSIDGVARNGTVYFTWSGTARASA